MDSPVCSMSIKIESNAINRCSLAMTFLENKSLCTSMPYTYMEFSIPYNLIAVIQLRYFNQAKSISITLTDDLHINSQMRRIVGIKFTIETSSNRASQ